MASREQLMQQLRSAHEAGDTETARNIASQVRAMDAQTAEAPQQETSGIEQGLNGVNEGIASILGFPVDITTSALNLGASGINALAGTEIPPIENPIGGSETFERLFRDTNVITDAEPQTTGQRFARSIGQEVGAMAIPGGAAASRTRSIGRALGLEGASALGAGVGAQAATEAFPDSQAAEFVGGLMGGLTPIGVSRAARPSPRAPSMEELRDRQSAAYERVDNAGATVSPASRDQLIDNLRSRVQGENIDDLLHPRAARMSERLDQMSEAPTVSEVERWRRLIGRDVAGASDAGERAMGVAMKDELDSYLRGLTDADMSGADASRVLSDLQEGRDLTGRIARAEMLEGDTGAVTRAERRAATSGTGGNEVNAIRQNIRAILDSPTKRRGYSEEEIRQMERIVNGTAVTNNLRRASALAPSKNGLSSMLGIGAGGAAAASGNPLFLAPSLAGEVSKRLGERITSGQVSRLSELIRNGAPLNAKTLEDYERAAAIGLMSSSLAAQ